MNFKALLSRFIGVYGETLIPVVGDVVASYSTFKSQKYNVDLALYQVRSRLLDSSIKGALVAFILKDDYFKKALSGVMGSTKPKQKNRKQPKQRIVYVQAPNKQKSKRRG
jgi:hypothetical protein